MKSSSLCHKPQHYLVIRATFYIEGKPSLFKGFVEARNSVPIHGHPGQTEPVVQPAAKVVRPIRAGFSFGRAKRAEEEVRSRS